MKEVAYRQIVSDTLYRRELDFVKLIKRDMRHRLEHFAQEQDGYLLTEVRFEVEEPKPVTRTEDGSVFFHPPLGTVLITARATMVPVGKPYDVLPRRRWDD